MTAPQRIQRKRIKGWRMPANTVYVGRGSRWGNPYSARGHKVYWQGCYQLSLPSRDEALSMVIDGFRELVDPAENAVARGDWRYPSTSSIRAHLGGKNLACWCPLDQPCHADVLLELANKEDVQ